MSNVRKVVLAYSGGLDTSVAVRWIAETYGCEVICYCADVGQGEDLEGARQKALSLGASKAIVHDLRETFVRDYVFPALRAGAIYESEYLLGTSLARPCITHGLMEAVREEGADAIGHGATGKGNDQVRFELAAYQIMPSVKIIAPWREWEYQGRRQLIDYAAERNIQIEATVEKPYSMDRNLLHISYEGGVLEDPWRAPDPEMFQWTRDPRQAPDDPRQVEIGFEEGVPVSVDGEALGPIALLEKLNAIAGEHGVGRVDIVENRFVGMKSRGIYETPGGTLLHAARRAIESLTLDREALHLRDDLMPRYARLVYNGFWFAPEREAIQALVDNVARHVTGVARLELYKGSLHVVGRKAEKSLYRPDIATFEEDSVYDQKDAAGFIRLQALRLRVGAER
ncbi:argininosuccinate synthase [Haliangium ochraceum]|uniref:Argininosuccinate synthase n=1 Tax=Haliangium ochraceum (strain DSM 14365 / JCM 11303 / SMP-2) TaxID=502025 RepID=D0LJ02_HALO1|nr:argininosuccinate synthase [Haliangium ochraceum]ACY13031.1 argininosuccinate synthase [Haliangium ochraceum DSM 14365]